MLIAAAAIVDCLERPSRFLAAQRAYPPALEGKWELPGGKVEPGEDPATACVRELAEELGIDVRLGQIVTNNGADWQIPVGQMRVWLAETSETPRPGSDHLALSWVEADTAMDLDWLEGDIPLARHLCTHVLIQGDQARGED